MKTKKNTKKKKVEVVFQEPKHSIKEKKETVIHNAKNNEKKEVHTHKVEHTHHYHKKNKNKDYIVIGILSLLIIGIILVAFLVPVNKDDAPIDDDNLDTNIPVNGLVDVNVEEFENKVLELNLKILKDMREYQQEILFSYSDELGLDLDLMNTCLLENNYLLDDANLFDFEKIKLIQDDFMQSQELQVSSTPTTLINGYYFSGAKDYNTLDSFLTAVSGTDNLELNYLDKSFNSTTDDLKLYIIYDIENDLIDSKNKEFMSYLSSSEGLVDNVKDVFTKVFSIEDTEYVQYDSELGKSILQTMDIKHLPVYYIQGDINQLDFNSDTLQVFNIIFNIEDYNDGYLISQDILPQLYMGSNIDGVYKILNFKEYLSEDDVTIGEKDSDLTLMLFTDYDCPYCKTFENETLSDEFFENYIESGKANLTIKPMVTNDVFSIFPILFFKCSDDQGVALEVHKKIFSLNSEIGVQKTYDVISQKYSQELEELEREYEIIMANTSN